VGGIPHHWDIFSSGCFKAPLSVVINGVPKNGTLNPILLLLSYRVIYRVVAMVNFRNAVFVKSAPNIKDAPDMGGVPEVLMLGRSNVGKSSLINALVGHKGLAKTSNTPGKTRLMNYFLIDNQLALVDLPGYGYAKVSKIQQQAWQVAFETYMRKREEIKLTLLLIDGRHGPQPSDVQMLDWLAAHNLPVTVILTKLDKINKNQYAKQQALTAQLLDVDREAVVLFSATGPIIGGGVGPLQQVIQSVVV